MLPPEEKHLSIMMAWLENSRSTWAWEDVDEMMRKEKPEKAWELLRDMIDITPDTSLAAVGAGPLEGFIGHHGRQFIDRIEEAAATDEKFWHCLRTIYYYEPKDLAQRVERAVAAPPVKPRTRTGRISKARARIITAWLHHSDTSWASDHLMDLIDSDPLTALNLIAWFAKVLEEEGDTDSLEDLSLHAFDELIKRRGPAVYDEVLKLMPRHDTIRGWVLSQQGRNSRSPAWEELLRRLP